jgi:hypothetical protein
MANAAMGTKRRIHSYYTPTSSEKLPVFMSQDCDQHDLYALHSLLQNPSDTRPLRYDESRL